MKSIFEEFATYSDAEAALSRLAVNQIIYCNDLQGFYKVELDQSDNKTLKLMAGAAQTGAAYSLSGDTLTITF